MARIFYSMAGEGRGHATRVRAIVEQLRGEHQFTLFAAGAAYELLASSYSGTETISVHRIPGLNFHYRNQRLDYAKTAFCELPPYLWGLRGQVSTMLDRMKTEKPALAITDFEPILPRAARRYGIPFLSIDHQHFLEVSDLSGLPAVLRWKAWLMGQGLWMFYRGQAKTVVSSFFSPPLRRGCERVVQVGVMLRPEVLSAVASPGEHLLVYLRRFGQDNVLDTLRSSGREVLVYGLGGRPSEDRVHYREVSERGFLEDLAGCRALITNGGNQVIGEAHWLGKPVLSMPESGNFEQAINAHFLRESGGDWMECEAFSGATLDAFLEKVDHFRSQIRPEAVNGNGPVLEIIRQHLPGGCQQDASLASVA